MPFEQPLPQALSPSRLQDFQSCPRRFQHASIERRRQPATYATAKGTFVHYVFERLFALPPAERTDTAAREFVPAAETEVLVEPLVSEIGLTTEVRSRLLAETDRIITRYFAMEDPRTVTSEGVEMRLTATVDGVPILGILDRLDRDDDGSLVIVDYKTGALPNRQYDSKTFANAELYAALCEEHFGERPRRIRLLYVTHGESVEREVTGAVLRARRKSAVDAWGKIKRFYDDGHFPATPSTNACRFCAYTELCRADGVPVPSNPRRP